MSITSADTVCRVCMISDMKLYNVQNDLQNVYERIAREKYNKVGYPVHMCYICLTVLRKCQMFMETARDTNNVLKQWYNQQIEMKVARPLYTYSLSKAELVTMYNKNMTLQNDIKVEEVESEQETVRQEYTECNTDVNIEKTDTDVQTDYSELLVNNDSTDTDTVEDNKDTQSDPVFVNRVGYTEISNLCLNLNDHTDIKTRITPHGNEAIPVKKCKTSNTKSQRRVPETSGETTTNEITPLNSTTSQSYSVRHRNTKRESTLRKNNSHNSGETGKLGKIVKTSVIQYRNRRLAGNTIKNSMESNKLAPNPIVKNKINTSNCKASLQQYKTRHTDEKQFKCDICDHQSIHQSNFVRHMKTHTGEKQFACNTCNYKCIQKTALISHMRTHTGEKRFSCDICDYKCNEKGDLVRHMKTHTGEKRFTCNTCNYKCIQKSNLDRHMRTHTGEKPFSCDICVYKCMWKNNLERHMRTHTGEKQFTCNTCNYKCIQKTTLVSHMKTHTGENRFTCNTCNYKSNQKDNLERHMKTHTGEKPFSCDICDYKCSRSYHLKRHLINKHVNKKRK